MPIGEFCNRDVVFAARDMSVLEGARLMRSYHVGALVVVADRDGRREPVGIVTDRDIVVEVVAKEVSPETVQVGEITSNNLMTVREQDGVFDTLQLMRRRGVRRAPVVDRDGFLLGIVTVDDLVALIAEEMTEVAKLISREQDREAQTRK